jgi:hypothetical protein
MYFEFLSVIRQNISNDKIIKIVNRALYIDYMFMLIIHSLVVSRKGIVNFLNELGIKNCSFMENEIILDKYQIRITNNDEKGITMRIGKDHFVGNLVKN